jgi:hypothetical protein
MNWVAQHGQQNGLDGARIAVAGDSTKLSCVLGVRADAISQQVGDLGDDQRWDEQWSRGVGEQLDRSRVMLIPSRRRRAQRTGVDDQKLKLPSACDGSSRSIASRATWADSTTHHYEHDDAHRTCR